MSTSFPTSWYVNLVEVMEPKNGLTRDKNRKYEKKRNTPTHSKISSDLQPSVKIQNTLFW